MFNSNLVMCDIITFKVRALRVVLKVLVGNRWIKEWLTYVLSAVLTIGNGTLTERVTTAAAFLCASSGKLHGMSRIFYVFTNNMAAVGSGKMWWPDRIVTVFMGETCECLSPYWVSLRNVDPSLWASCLFLSFWPLTLSFWPINLSLDVWL